MNGVGSPRPDVLASPGFGAWLHHVGAALAVTTYRANKVLLLGHKPDGGLAVFERTFERAMAIWAAHQRLYLATRQQVWRLEGTAAEAPHDRAFVPRLAHVTGPLDIHDLHVTPASDPGALDDIVAVATRLSAVVRLHPAHGVDVVWTPPFISAVAPDDRCHLNGMAVVDGRPRYATVVAASDTPEGWRATRDGGGRVLDMATGATVARGLCMPHSPRWHAGRLWLLNAGTGDFGYLDGLETGAARFVPVGFCPGYARGLAFVGGHAVIGVSQGRDATFRDLPLDDRLGHEGAGGWAGLLVMDPGTGSVVHHAIITAGDPTELYDVQAIPGVHRPRLEGILALLPPTRGGP